MAQVQAMATMLRVDQAVAKSWACLDQQRPEVIEVLLANRVVALKGSALAQQQAIFVQTQILHIPMAHDQSHHGLAAALEVALLNRMDPLGYQAVVEKREAKLAKGGAGFHHFIKQVEQLLSRKSIKFQLQSSQRSAYSIYQKKSIPLLSKSMIALVCALL